MMPPLTISKKPQIEKNESKKVPKHQDFQY